MADELSYVILTPYSIRKSRTGGIIGRLLARTGLDLAAAQMFSPSPALVEKFAAQIETGGTDREAQVQSLIGDYLRKNFVGPGDARHRVMLLVFRGDEAIAKVRDAVGRIAETEIGGETIRDTFGDTIANPEGEVTYFEPAVLAPQDAAACRRDLRLWAAHAATDGGVLSKVARFPHGANVEETLVLIKPDNFRYPSARPGNVIDAFSRTGLYIIGIKVHRMTVAQAEEFYGPVLAVLQDKLRATAGVQARQALEGAFGFPLDDALQERLGEMLGPVAGRWNWESIVHFMTGRRPGECPPELRAAPGTEKCIALVYQGVDAVRKIREVLGPTDPSKAPPGSIRREFGQTIMVNAAHASDSAANARREMGIVRIAENNLCAVVEKEYGLS